VIGALVRDAQRKRSIEGVALLGPAPPRPALQNGHAGPPVAACLAGGDILPRVLRREPGVIHLVAEGTEGWVAGRIAHVRQEREDPVRAAPLAVGMARNPPVRLPQ